MKDELANTLWSYCRMQPLNEYLEEHRPYFTWSEVDDWIAAGHHVGLHTRSHPRCSRLTRSEAEIEVAAPAADLRRRFSLGFLPFIYPFGDRLTRELEQELFEKDVFDCAFGIRGMSSCGVPPTRLERAGAEEMGARWAVYGDLAIRPFVDGIQNRLGQS